jgi:hypothetical protein
MTIKLIIVVFSLLFGGESYEIVTSNPPSDLLVSVCRADVNCMDVVSIDEETGKAQAMEDALNQHDCWDQGTIKGTDLCMMIAYPEKGLF